MGEAHHGQDAAGRDQPVSSSIPLPPPFTPTSRNTDDLLDSTNVSVPHSADRTDPSKLNIPKHEDMAPAPIDSSIDKWFYISGASA